MVDKMRIWWENGLTQSNWTHLQPIKKYFGLGWTILRVN